VNGKVLRVLNVFLRGMTLVSKFSLIFVLAKYLDAAELGLYGLVVATVTYSLYLVGLDFYSYSNREIIKSSASDWGWMVKSHTVLVFMLYAFCFPVLTMLFFYGYLPWFVAVWFFVLIVTEHLSQEMTRLLVALGRPISASVVLFLRSGLWAIILSGVLVLVPDSRELINVFVVWSIGGASAVVFGAIFLLQVHGFSFRGNVDLKWVFKGVKVAGLLLVATLSVRGIYTLDRYLVESFVGLEALGAYVLFIGICNALMSFLDAAVFSFSYPKLVADWSLGEIERFYTGVVRLAKQTLLVSVGFMVFSYLSIDAVLQFLAEDLFWEYKESFYWLVLSSVFYGLSMVPHYALYAQGHDRLILISHVLGFSVFVLSAWWFSGFYREMAVPFSLVLAFLSIFLMKSVAFVLRRISYSIDS